MQIYAIIYAIMLTTSTYTCTHACAQVCLANPWLSPVEVAPRCPGGWPLLCCWPAPMAADAQRPEATEGGAGDWADGWRWGLWSPSDRTWHAAVRARWGEASQAPEREEPAIPPKLHQVWLGERAIPPECLAMMEAWKDLHPAWEYRLWADADAEDLLRASPRLAEAFAQASNPAEKSDILRLEIVRQHGGLHNIYSNNT